jgi:hypothetical protein
LHGVRVYRVSGSVVGSVGRRAGRLVFAHENHFFLDVGGSSLQVE